MMRVVFVNWADFRAGALFGGGVNGYLQSLALELKSRGHDVISLTGGWTYLRERGRTPGECRVRRLEDFEGVSRFEVVNSPIVAPGIFQAANPEAEIESEELEEVFRSFVSMCQPDVVHFHNIEGFSASCVRMLTSMPGPTRPAVVFSLHNYHTVCPQVYLMRSGRFPCKDFENGSACGSCMNWADRLEEITTRCGIRTSDLEGVSPEHLDPLAQRSVHSTWRPVVGAEDEPLENDPDLEGPVTSFGNGYARRRKAMIDMLSSCDAVLAVSGFVERKFAALGVDRSRLKRMPIGTSLATNGRSDERKQPIGRNRPIRLVFMGYHNYYKGLHMLVDSLLLLEHRWRRRIELHLFAKDLNSMEDRLHLMRSDLAGVFIKGEYRREELPRLLSDMDLGVVPSVWWDNGPQTVMEFLACGVPVVGAELGGIPDLVRHGENGWLFRGNDRGALMRQLAALVEDPQSIDRAAANIKPMLSIQAHAGEMTRVYEGIAR